MNQPFCLIRNSTTCHLSVGPPETVGRGGPGTAPCLSVSHFMCRHAHFLLSHFHPYCPTFWNSGCDAGLKSPYKQWCQSFVSCFVRSNNNKTVQKFSSLHDFIQWFWMPCNLSLAGSSLHFELLSLTVIATMVRKSIVARPDAHKQ